MAKLTCANAPIPNGHWDTLVSLEEISHIIFSIIYFAYISLFLSLRVLIFYKPSLCSRFQGIDQIGALPAETAIRIRRAAKVAVGSCALINGFVQTQMRADAAWS